MLHRVTAERKEIAFFNAWTRKEAYLKAVGEKLAVALSSFDVTLAPSEPARMIALNGDPAAAERWFYLHLDPEPRYVGAVAIELAERAEIGRISSYRMAL